MYANCMFCHRPLGENAVIEHFPVGRRLAFDSERGRLWVICRKCDRWNLTPLEERWEAVEETERFFRDTRVRVSTENVGLARLPEGLELVRIGRPLRPEFAAWRYGDQFGRRRKRAILYGTGIAAVVGGIGIGGVAVGGANVPGWVLWNWWSNQRTVVRIPLKGQGDLRLSNQDLKGARLLPAREGDGLVLEVRKSKARYTFEGEEAVRRLGRVLPRVNWMGGTPDTVRRAVAEIEEDGHPDLFLRQLTQSSGQAYRDKKGIPGYLNKMPPHTKLALEMALHEDQERRALAGELWLLEEAWREAEEIAAISDDLLLPPGAEEFIARHRSASPEGGAEEAPGSQAGQSSQPSQEAPTPT
jgi:hypothetical protein